MIDPLKHQKLVFKIAHKFTGRGLCLEDLIAEGQIGLLIACRKFKPELGFEFSTYAMPWITRTISRAIDDQVSLLFVPPHVQERLRYKKSSTRASAESLKAGKAALRKHFGDSSMECIGEWVSMGSMAYDYRPTTLDQRIAAHDLAVFLEALSPREAEVIRMRHGLDEAAEMSLKEIGTAIGTTWQRAQQIEARAMTKLRDRAHFESRGIAS